MCICVSRVHVNRDRCHAKMVATPGLRNMLENISPPILVLLLLTTLIAGGIILLIRYVVDRRSRSSLEQDSSKSLDQIKKLWKPTASSIDYIPIAQEPPIYSNSLRDGQRILLNKKRNKQVLLIPAHSWLNATLRGHTGLICDMNFSSNGKYVASCAEDRSLQPEEHVHWQSNYNRFQTEINVTSILPSPCSNVTSSLEISNNRYHYKNQEKNPETQERVTIDIAYRRNNERRGQSFLWYPMYFLDKNTDADVNWKTEKQNEQNIDINLYYHDNYKSERQNISLNDSSLCRMIENYILTLNDLTNRGYPVESNEFPGCAMINNITYPASQNFRSYIQNNTTNIRTEEKKNNQKDSDSGNCSNESSDSSEHEQESLHNNKNGKNSKEKSNDNDSDSSKKCDSSLKQEKRRCVRCHKSFYVDHTGKYLYIERCVYHWGKLFDGRTNGEINCKYWTCCRNLESSSGCETGIHVWNGLIPGINGPFEGYVRTLPFNRQTHDNNYGIYAIDCEMCYTQYGLELTKVTLVDLFGNIVYNTFVKPSTEIIDYNTRFSGITEEHISEVTVTLEQVQKELITFIHAETILLGHNLASDFRMLRLFHEKVVDTTAMFPHDYGFPYCIALKTLARKVLKRNIQENTHDSVEDARVVVDLVLRKVHYDLTSIKTEKSA